MQKKSCHLHLKGQPYGKNEQKLFTKWPAGCKLLVFESVRFTQLSHIQPEARCSLKLIKMNVKICIRERAL